MKNYDDLSLEEKIKTINENAEKIVEAMKPVFESLIKALEKFSKAAAFAGYSVMTDDFKRMYMYEMKKERHLKRYNRMMARRK
jgi:hypothetical protein